MITQLQEDTIDAIDTMSSSEASALYGFRTAEEDDIYKEFSWTKIRRIRKNLKSRDIVLDEYTNQGKKYKNFFCLKENHNWSALLEEFYQTKRRCPECFPEDAKGLKKRKEVPYRLDLAEVQERLKARGVEVVVDTYKTTQKSAQIRCLKCGNIDDVGILAQVYDERARKIACSKCCPYTSTPRKVLKEEIISYFLTREIDILEYKPTRDYSKIRCMKCNCIWLRKGLNGWYRFLRKSPNKLVFCPCCSKHKSPKLDALIVIKEGKER